MDQNFIRNLCEQEKLLDIGKLGKASQSSLSRWSKSNDAQRAVSNSDFSDFAFHTEKEENPWWQIEFENSFLIEYIIVNNRKRKPFDEIASSLKVVAYDKNDVEIVVFTGISFFGSVPNELPFIISLKGKVEIKKIRITLLKENYLHLSNIRFLIKDALKQQEKRMIFVANRHDGMGERLRAILNAMILAKKMNSNFLFSWVTDDMAFHATSEKDLIFSKKFQEESLRDRKNLNKLSLFPIRKIPHISVRDLEKYDGILVEQFGIERLLPYPYTDFDSKSYRTAFEEIGFSDKLVAAKNHANTIDMPHKTVAIHIRAGDIVYGRYRNMPNFYNKVTPFYLLDRVIKNLIVQELDIIIFGQDDYLCEYFAKKYNVLYSKNLLKTEYNESQIALFDITLMSRCSIIIAGYSGFAVLAEWIGGLKIKDCYHYFSDEQEIISEFNKLYNDPTSFFNLENINPLVKSFSISQFVNSYKQEISLNEKISYIEECVNLDSQGLYNKFFLASLYFENGDNDKGNRILIDQMQGESLKDLENLAKIVHGNNTTPISPLMKNFELASSNGSIVASFLLLLNDIYFTKKIDFSFYQDIIQKNKSEDFGIDLIKSYLENAK